MDSNQKSMKISQETFDEVVKENFEVFELSEVEAWEDAKKQFEKLGADTSSIITSIEQKKIHEIIKQSTAEIKYFLKVKSSTLETLQIKLEDLIYQLEPLDTKLLMIAEREAVELLFNILETHLIYDSIIKVSLQLTAIIFHNKLNRNFFDLKSAKILRNCLNFYENNTKLLEIFWIMASNIIVHHEANKRLFKDVNINDNLLLTISKHRTENKLLYNACNFIRIYLSDDDLREGVHPGTFQRAKEIGENFHSGLLSKLLSILSDKTIFCDKKLMIAIISSIKAIAVNDQICKQIMSNNGLDIVLEIMDSFILEENIAISTCQFLKTVARNDDIKKFLAKGKGLMLLIASLEIHSNSVEVCEQAIQCLSVMCLRQPDICKTIANLNIIQSIISSMEHHESASMIQRASISMIRNMISDWKTKDLVQQILDLNAESLIRKARILHQESCEEVAFAALRDLGLEYH